MGNEVYANGREISCKAADGKSICAFPDVCLSPPPPPAGPLPIPYPNTGMAGDTSGGSKSVQISGQEVMLKDSSSFKKSTGDEAATKAQGMGVVTHTIQGKVYFSSWSMDVKVEGENAVRHLDMTVHNCNSSPPQTPPWPYIDAMAVALDPCAKEKDAEEKACKGQTNPCPPGKKRPASAKAAAAYAAKIKANPCLVARRCKLQPYNKTKKGKGGCCPGQTGHHLVPKASFKPKSKFKNYKQSEAPCICVEGANHGVGTHGQMHTVQSYSAIRMKKGTKTLSRTQKSAAGAVKAVFPESGCSSGCMEAQLKAYHEDKAKVSPDAPLKPPATNKPSTEKVRAVVAAAKAG